jgi:hypothetical protein
MRETEGEVVNIEGLILIFLLIPLKENEGSFLLLSLGAVIC